MSKQQSLMCKGLAIILMYIHHLFYSQETFAAYSINFFPLTMERGLQIADVSKVCVAIFVFLTGYGYTLSERNNVSDYKKTFAKRYLHLMLNFWIIFIISLMTSVLGRDIATVYGDNLLIRIAYIFIDAMGLADIFHTPTFNATWWYMSYAILLVFFTPVLIKLCKEIKYALIPIAILLPRFFTISNIYTTFYVYLFTLVLGITAAEFDWYKKIQNFFHKKIYLDIVICLIMGFFLSYLRLTIGCFDVVDGLLSFIICYMVFRIIAKIPVLNTLLALIGKHSYNLFLTHTFINGYYFSDFIYSFGYWLLIVLIEIVITLMLSLCIEKFKKIIRIANLENIILKRLMHGAI